MDQTPAALKPNTEKGILVSEKGHLIVEAINASYVTVSLDEVMVQDGEKVHAKREILLKEEGKPLFNTVAHRNQEVTQDIMAILTFGYAAGRLYLA